MRRELCAVVERHGLVPLAGQESAYDIAAQFLSQLQQEHPEEGAVALAASDDWRQLVRHVTEIAIISAPSLVVLNALREKGLIPAKEVDDPKPKAQAAKRTRVKHVYS